MAKNKLPGFATRAIHVGQEPDPLTGAVTVPIYPTSTYVQQELGKHKGYEYSRVSNPTRDRLEQNLAALERGSASRVFASGMAAINAICTTMKAGDHVVCGHDLYGGVPRLFNQVLADLAWSSLMWTRPMRRTCSERSGRTLAWCTWRHRPIR